MKQYSIFCTQEQTNRAYKLGAPIDVNHDVTSFIRPTTQQMIGWIRETYDILINVTIINGHYRKYHTKMPMLAVDTDYNIYQEAELAAIDAVLDYLEKGEIK